MSVLPIKGAIQHYAWGGKSFIPELIQVENVAGEPFAELWMGAHDRGPATLEGESMTLAAYIANDPVSVLGATIASTFDNRLPFLFKILDVNSMLSIQSHPTKQQAETGFKRENEAGVPIKAFHRNFRDDNHKPEIMIALTDFWLLHGFKSEEAIAKVLDDIPELEVLKPQFVDRSIYDLYKYIMELPQDSVNTILAPLQDRLMTIDPPKSSPDYWAKLAFKDYTRDGQFDRGIFSIYIFNLVNLKTGEGIYQAAGIPHAYLEGVNVELMANSDNVFRGGLTPKNIDVPELLKHLVAETVTPNILKGTSISDLERVYDSPAPDFLVSCIELNPTQVYERQTDAPDILILLEGAVTVNSDNTSFERKKGEIFFASYGTTYEMTASEYSVIYRASVPQ